MLLFVLYLILLFSGNVANIPAMLQPSSFCQRFRLLTFVVNASSISQSYSYVVRPTHNSFALAKGAVSLFSSRAAALVSRFSRALAVPPVNVKKKKERLLAVYEKSVRLHRVIRTLAYSIILKR